MKGILSLHSWIAEHVCVGIRVCVYLCVWQATSEINKSHVGAIIVNNTLSLGCQSNALLFQQYQVFLGTGADKKKKGHGYLKIAVLTNGYLRLFGRERCLHLLIVLANLELKHSWVAGVTFNAICACSLFFSPLSHIPLVIFSLITDQKSILTDNDWKKLWMRGGINADSKLDNNLDSSDSPMFEDSEVSRPKFRWQIA